MLSNSKRFSDCTVQTRTKSTNLTVYNKQQHNEGITEQAGRGKSCVLHTQKAASSNYILELVIMTDVSKLSF
jgi:hypothetical protein